MGEANFACPLCQAAHLDPLTVSRDIVKTHDLEHRGGDHGSTAWYDWTSGRVVRDGNGNRWTNREPYNPQPKSDEPWFDILSGAEVEKPLPDGKGVGLKLSDFIKALDDAPTDEACDAGACDCGDDEEEERITDEAWRLVMGDRQSSYNHPARDFEATGRMWGAILTNWLNLEEPMPDIDPRIVALMIGMVKVSRESHKHKHDNLVDLIGYALCADRVERGY